jgi:hypothetical protein
MEILIMNAEKKGGNIVESIEQEFIAMLSRLPIPITIIRSGLYHWQCLQGTGSSRRLATAVEAALAYLLSNPTVQVISTERAKNL